MDSGALRSFVLKGVTEEGRKACKAPGRLSSEGTGILQESTCLHTGEGCLILGSCRGKRKKEG